MRRGPATVLLIVLGLLLLGCGGASRSNPSSRPSASPSELLNMSFAAPVDGNMGQFKSEPFTTHGGPLMVYLDVTKWGTVVYPGLEDQGWTGMINCFLQVPGSYWNPDTAPLASFNPDPLTDNKYVTQFGAYQDSLPAAGTYILRVEAQNFDGTITLLELP